jgi:hypothetical protein
MAPPGTITTHDITTIVIVPFFNGARLCTGATAMMMSEDGYKAEPGTNPVSMRFPAACIMLEQHHEGSDRGVNTKT